MPSPRSLILISVAVVLISLIVSVLSMLRPIDSGGEGRDTYGVRGDGFRAVYELLNEFNISVDRGFHPPEPDDKTATVALLAPDRMIAGTEPTYIRSLVPWIQDGGRLIVANRVSSSPFAKMRQMQMAESGFDFPSIWESLGLTDLQILSDGSRFEPDESPAITEEYFEGLTRRPSVGKPVEVHSTGSLKTSLNSVQKITLPGDTYAEILTGDEEPIGTLVSVTGDGDEQIIAAEFAMGKGRIIVVANAALFANRFLPQSDNSIVAARLLSPTGESVMFDEFFHGLGVRGNSLYLLTRPGYAAIALGLLIFVCLSSWRAAVLLGPPLADQEHPRRDIREYVDAMGRFFLRGRSSRPFLVKRIRAGVLRELCVAVSLPPENQDVDLVVAAIARTNPKRADRVRQAFNEADGATNGRGQWKDAQTLKVMRELTACL